MATSEKRIARGRRQARVRRRVRGTDQLPDGIDAKVERQVLVTIEGNNKQLLGEVCAQIRALRPPEPYKGKGIKYANEHIRRKAGKAAGAAGR